MTPTHDPLHGLKDFQRATSRYAFQRLYTDENPTHRFLIADEVGLGKTLVARGLIAQAIEHMRAAGEKRIDIVYVCSNGSIARQNVRRLDVTETASIDDGANDRLTMLPLQLDKLGDEGINIFPITPGTSFNLGSNAGKFAERALMFTLLRLVWGRDRLKGSGPARLFYRGISDDDSSHARRRLYRLEKEYAEKVPKSFVRAFRSALVERNKARIAEGRPRLQQELDELAGEYQRQRRWKWKVAHQRNLFIGELRQLVAEEAIRELRADLVIMDEFQRFKRLLDQDSSRWENRIAMQLFNSRTEESSSTRVVLLSATPYRMYTRNDDPEGDDHHEDLIHTLRFLFDDEAAAEHTRQLLRGLRRGLLAGTKEGIDAAEQAAHELTAHLRKVMARTERLSSETHRVGMLVEDAERNLAVDPDDVIGFVTAHRISRELGVATPIELWKSGAYLINFLEGYALEQKLSAQIEAEGDSPTLREAVSIGAGLLDWQDLENYQPLDPGNGRLRALVDDMVSSGLWKLLWMPPALRYYSTQSEFDTESARIATKRLVFSSWRLVPKVISAIASYEAERRMFDMGEAEYAYSEDFSNRASRNLDFRMDETRPGAMTSFAFVYPSLALARLGEPRADVGNAELPAIDEIRARVRNRIEEALRRHLDTAPTEGVPDQRWIWAAPLLLDREDGDSWIGQQKVDTWTQKDTKDSGFASHLDWAQEWVRSDLRLGRVPDRDELLDALTQLAIGGPAACAMRALAATLPGASVADRRQAAARIAWGFRALFNGPAETALVSDQSHPYWRAAARYCVDGHLQAVLDEYIHVLREWTGNIDSNWAKALSDIKEAVYSALTLRTTRYSVRIPTISDDGISLEEHRIRGRYAVQYGRQTDSEGSTVRANQVSDVFNSPFWPFVLATTSIGQEGLDFHLYCHAVVHWNLPHNPVDLEQREGRVHRYKGHAVRKNLAKHHGLEARAASDPWKELFDAGLRSRNGGTDLVPFWLYRRDSSDAAIERHVPMFALSRERTRFPSLMSDVAEYRLAFGQPNQQDLLRFLRQKHSTDEIGAISERVRIDLSPPRL